MDFPASSSVVPTCSQLSCFGQQPGRTRKNKTPRVVPGQQRLLRRGRSVGMPAAERSLDVVGDRCRQQSAGVPGRTATASPSPPDSVGLNEHFEEGDITIDDAEFRKSVISFRQQLSKSYRDMKYLNNPELDRSEFAEWVRHFTYDVAVFSGFVVTAALLLYAVYTILDHFGLAHPPPDRKEADFFLLVCYFSALFLTAGFTPLMSILSFYLSNNVAAIVDAYEKKVASTSDESPTEKFLKKYDRIESLLDCLNKLRCSTYITEEHRRPVSVRDLPKLVVNFSDSGVDGKPLRHVTVEEQPKPHRLESMDFSLFFSGAIENRRNNLESAIVKTRNWLDRAQKQVRLIRGDRPSGAQRKARA